MLNCHVLTSAALLFAMLGLSDSETVTSSMQSPQSTMQQSALTTIQQSKPKSCESSTPTSDPSTAVYSFSVYCIGDWGKATYKGSCCGGKHNNYDLNAQEVVGVLMDVEARTSTVKPKVVLGHGDSFYWNGIISLETRDARFAATFEPVYSGESLKNVPWVNVMGNHDYGGAQYICNVGELQVACNSTDELLQGLENKLKWQAEYTSPNNDRWNMNDHYYAYQISDEATGVSMDIFNVETNDANVHGAESVCCQCYGYAKADSSGCNDAKRGYKYCCGGNTTLFDSCMDQFDSWGNQSRTQLATDLKHSSATWKIVNTHFSPYAHYEEPGMNKWFDVLRKSGLHAFLYGHTHAEKHDYSKSLGIHFVENGAGGGQQKEPASKIPDYATKDVENKWAYTADEYGFFSLQVSKDWLKLQYHTADTNWNFTENFADTKIGGVVTKHCYYIPHDGSEGRAC